MKKIVLSMLFFVGITFAQEVSVISVLPVTSLEQGQFYYPLGNIDDSKIIFSSESYKGLWMLDNKTGSIEKLNDYYSAGYEPAFTDANKIVHRKDDYKNNRRFISIYEYNVTEKSETIIETELRDMAQIKVFNGEVINYSKNKNLLEVELNNKLTKKATNNSPVVMIENSSLVLYINGVREVVNPIGDGNYLWASVSPDGSKLLFTFAGQGSFITDLTGNIISELGYAHYPQWSSNGEWVIYMKDYDDGEKVIESDLYLYSIDSEKEFKITDTKEIHEMYPVWAKSENAIYCNSSDGIIYKIELKLN